MPTANRIALLIYFFLLELKTLRTDSACFVGFSRLCLLISRVIRCVLTVCSFLNCFYFSFSRIVCYWCAGVSLKKQKKLLFFCLFWISSCFFVGCNDFGKRDRSISAASTIPCFNFILKDLYLFSLRNDNKNKLLINKPIRELINVMIVIIQYNELPISCFVWFFFKFSIHV